MLIVVDNDRPSRGEHNERNSHNEFDKYSKVQGIQRNCDQLELCLW